MFLCNIHILFINALQMRYHMSYKTFSNAELTLLIVRNDELNVRNNELNVGNNKLIPFGQYQGKQVQEKLRKVM
jgi:hypothetical protein